MKRKDVDECGDAAKRIKTGDHDGDAPKSNKVVTLWQILMSGAAHDFGEKIAEADLKILANDGSELWYHTEGLRLNTTAAFAAAMEADGSQEMKIDATRETINDYLNCMARPPAMRSCWMFAHLKNKGFSISATLHAGVQIWRR